MSQILLTNLQCEKPLGGEGFFLFPHRCIFIFYFFMSCKALRSSWWEGDITSFPPRMKTVLSVTFFSSLTLLPPLAYFHILVSKTQFYFLTSLLRDLRRLSSDLTYFKIYKKEDSQLVPNLKQYIHPINEQCKTNKFNIIQFHHIFTFTY